MVLGADAWGPPRGAPVVLLHGGGQTRHAWKGTGRRLGEQGYRVLAYDARGHGDSTWAPDGDYSEAALVADLVSVIQFVNSPKPPALIGASMGGLTALAATGGYGVPASALALVDVAPRVETAGVRRVVEFMRSGEEGFDSLDEMAAVIAAYQPHRERPATSHGVAKNARLGDDGRYRWHWDPALVSTSDPHGNRQRFESYARAVTVPALLVRGGLSDVVSEAGARELSAAMPHLEVAEVSGASHMIAGDDNGMFVEHVTRFLARHI